MTRQPLVARHVEELLSAAVVSTAPVAGGDVCTATRLRLSDGRVALAKTHPHAPEGFFEAEARGLRWLAEATDQGGVPVPELLAADASCVVLRWVEPGKPTADAALAFGAALAATHLSLPTAAGDPAYGAEQDGFVGRLPLPNRTAPSWAEFWATRRVLPYLKLARDRDAVTADEARAVEGVVGRLPALLPDEPPARLHGDLWNGNVLWGHDGVSVVDPAAYAGHREVDLAMLLLFGSPHLDRVLEGYAAASAERGRPLDDAWRDRAGVHQLFPLLVHACTFGGGYGARAADVARRLA
ncbi:fructosamine kinase family protein [Nocardioides perillae]|uniref:Fructosamine-3-kinase n=1 Tax=Nocardioides perillae TaxID=1119534 RepID=A0A7Y9RST3_9ACTN|nr:fructosamine-3-kinase [Nocardioides perillae]